MEINLETFILNDLRIVCYICNKVFEINKIEAHIKEDKLIWNSKKLLQPKAPSEDDFFLNGGRFNLTSLKS